jgi:tetratricopeptide (TPR) repeat protein
MTALIEHLKNLERLEIISLDQSDSELEYAFKHVFTQESVYSSLLHSDRRRIHQRVGEVLERLLSQTLEDGDTAFLLAYHFEQSEDKARALNYMRCAAASARNVYANQEAKSLYMRAIALLDKDDYANRWQLLASQERILDRLGERERQADTLIQMQTVAELRADDEILAVTHNRRSVYFDKVSEYQAAAEAAAVGLRVARRSSRAHLQAESLNLLALAAWRRFDYPQVQHWASQALEALQVIGHPAARVTSLFHLGKASYRLGQYDRALEYCQAAQKLTHNTDNRDGEATSYLILGWIYQRLGDYELAAQNYREKLNVRRTIGDRYGEATALSHLGWVAFDQQDPQAGQDYCCQALAISQAINDRENEAYALSGLGLNHEALEDLDAAASSYRAALNIHTEIGASTLAIFDRAGLARIALAQDDRSAALDHIAPVAGWIKSGNAQKFWDPWIIYQSAYGVLATLEETDTALAILDEAHTVLHQRANKISDKDLRDCFLSKVAANQALNQAWHESHRLTA